METRHMLYAILLLIATVIIGVGGFMLLESMHPMEALWLTVVSLTTVGFGDIVPVTTAGRLFAVVLILGGVGLFAYTLSRSVLVLMEGHFKSFWERSAMNKKISHLTNHFIICGCGRVGLQVIQRLAREKVPIVVIELSPERVEQFASMKVLAVIGDAANDQVLIEAGIQRARGLVAALPSDAQNVFITLTAKELNSEIRVIARCDRLESEARLRRAGADRVISPAVIAGRQMAVSLLKPTSVDFVDTLIDSQGTEFEFEELKVTDQSPLAGASLRNSKIREKTGIMVIAIKRSGQTLTYPTAEEVINPGDLLIVIGPREQISKLEALTH